MKIPDILAAGEAVAFALINTPERLSPEQIQDLVDESAKLFVARPAPAEINAVAVAAKLFLDQCAKKRGTLYLIHAEPAGGVH